LSFHDNLLNKKSRPRSVQARMQPAGNDNASNGSIEKNSAKVGGGLTSLSKVTIKNGGQLGRSQADKPSDEKGPEGARPYSVASLASRWECSEGIIRGLIRDRALDHFRIGTLVRIRATEVERYECR